MRLFEVAELIPFTTDPVTPNQIDMLKDPEYMAKKKGMVGEIVWMSPQEYIERCERGFKSTGSKGLVRQGRDPKLIKQYAQEMQKGDKFPMLELDYRGGFAQEGLHRAMAAELLGVRKVPVFVTKESPEFAAKRNAERRSEFDKIKAQASEWEKERQSSVVDDILGAFESKLTEGVSPIVHHFMGIRNAESVLAQDKFRLTAAPGTDTERALQKGDRMYYLSTTRHKLGGYHINNSWSGVIFELDGEKLGQNYAAKPVDYWGPEWYTNKAQGGKGPEEKEAEDRVYSRKPYIPNASKYIRAVHVLFDEYAQEKQPKLAIDVRRLFITAKRRGVDAYLYTEKQDWLLQDKRKAVNPASLPAIAGAKGKEKDQSAMWHSTVHRRSLSPWIELYKAPVGSNISKAARDTRYNYVLYGYSDAARSLAADIHNAKSKPADETGLDTLLQIFRKEGIKTPQQYLDLLKDKWKPKEEAINEYTEVSKWTDDEEGNIFGYVVDTEEEQLVNYFVMNHGVDMDVINAIKAEYSTIAIARGMTVDEEHKNKGHGTELLGEFIEAAASEGAEAIFCVADIYEDNDFDLVKWYESWGFQTITQTSAGPMMVLEL
jgi:GNAT superfamily N-acetyltransferase